MKIFRTISAIILAFLVFFSSTSFMVGFHFCQGKIQKVALFTKAEGCKMPTQVPSCHKHVTNPCCDDEVVFHEASSFKGSVDQIQLHAPAAVDLSLPPVLISEIIPAASVARTEYYNYDPPLRSVDLSLTHRVFLI